MEEAAPHNTGMPQLDPTSYPSQIFWLMVTFVVLYAVLSRFVLPRIGTVLESRQSKIDADLSRASHLKDTAEAAREAYEKGLVQSRQRSQMLLSETKAAADKASAARRAELDAKLAANLSAAEAKIRDARATALDSLAPVAAELAGEIVTKLSQHRPSEAELKDAVSKSSQNPWSVTP